MIYRILWCNGHIIAFKIHTRINLQNDKPQAFSEGGDPPSTTLLPRGRPSRPHPLTLIKNELKLGWLTLLRRNLNLIETFFFLKIT